MPLATPRYIVEANIADPRLRYEWDDWNVQQLYKSEDKELRERLVALSYRANLAFTIACGEWIIHRYDGVSDDPVPMAHMEAMWAGVVDSRYVKYWEPPDEFWLGPMRGALQLAIIFSLEALVDADACGDVALSAEAAANVAEHIMSDPGMFRGWREQVLERLGQLYPYDADDPMGDVVPREALDPNFEFGLELTEDLVRAYLRALDPSINRFLRSAGEMLERGFKGNPYDFDLEADRVQRNDF